MTPFRHESPLPADAVNKSGECEVPRALPLSIQNLRPPLQARVRLRNGRPCALESAVACGEIQHCAGPWRTTGSWWNRGERFAFDHFDVAMDAGLLLRLRYDHIKRSWQIDAVYD